MKHDHIYQTFLDRQRDQAFALADASDLLNVQVLPGLVPSQDVAEFRCQGLIWDEAGKARTHDRWIVGIRFPEQYLRRSYQVPEILTYLGTSPAPLHPNLRPPFVCLRIEVGMPLKEILHGLFDLFSWNLYANHDPLNEAAAQWARRQPAGTFPVDARPLKWRGPVGASSVPFPSMEGGGR